MPYAKRVFMPLIRRLCPGGNRAVQCEQTTGSWRDRGRERYAKASALNVRSTRRAPERDWGQGRHTVAVAPDGLALKMRVRTVRCSRVGVDDGEESESAQTNAVYRCILAAKACRAHGALCGEDCHVIGQSHPREYDRQLWPEGREAGPSAGGPIRDRTQSPRLALQPEAGSPSTDSRYFLSATWPT
jgi:hypothetical protein